MIENCENCPYQNPRKKHVFFHPKFSERLRNVTFYDSQVVNDEPRPVENELSMGNFCFDLLIKTNMKTMSVFVSSFNLLNVDHGHRTSQTHMLGFTGWQFNNSDSMPTVHHSSDSPRFARGASWTAARCSIKACTVGLPLLFPWIANQWFTVSLKAAVQDTVKVMDRKIKEPHGAPWWLSDGISHSYGTVKFIALDDASQKVCTQQSRRKGEVVSPRALT